MAAAEGGGLREPWVRGRGFRLEGRTEGGGIRDVLLGCEGRGGGGIEIFGVIEGGAEGCACGFDGGGVEGCSGGGGDASSFAAPFLRLKVGIGSLEAPCCALAFGFVDGDSNSSLEVVDSAGDVAPSECLSSSPIFTCGSATSSSNGAYPCFCRHRKEGYLYARKVTDIINTPSPRKTMTI